MKMIYYRSIGIIGTCLTTNTLEFSNEYDGIYFIHGREKFNLVRIPSTVRYGKEEIGEEVCALCMNILSKIPVDVEFEITNLEDKNYSSNNLIFYIGVHELLEKYGTEDEISAIDSEILRLNL